MKSGVFSFGGEQNTLYVFCMDSVITDRKIGVEVECVLPVVGTGTNIDVQELLANVLTAQGLRSVARSYSHAPVVSGCQMVIEHDSSLRDESRFQGIRWAKIEAKTAPMTFAELEQVLPRALEIINYLGARCNASCGLHVHHHLPECVDRPEVVRNLQHLWWRFHQVMYGLVAPSRTLGPYCRPPQLADAQRFDAVRSYQQLCRELSRCQRYDGLNTTNLAQGRMTVEWRLHSGTTDWNKIRAWVLATQRWTEHAVSRSCHFKPAPVPNTQEGLNALLVTTGLKPNSRIYSKVQKELREVGRFLLRRWKRFNVRSEYKAKASAA